MRRERILFVDDEPEVCDVFAAHADSLGYAADIAGRGQEAIELVREHTYDAVVVDIKLPDLDGIELVGRLRRIAPSMGFLIATGYPSKALTASQLASLGVTGVLYKPLSREELARGLEESLADARKHVVSNRAWRVLIIENQATQTSPAAMYLSTAKEFCEPIWKATLEEGIEEIRHGAVDVALLDIDNAAAHEGAFGLISQFPEVPVIVISTSTEEDAAVQAVQHGAQDFLVKERLSAEVLRRSLRHAVERKRAQERLAYTTYYDETTGLGNRKLFYTQLSQALARSHRRGGALGVILFDINRFKHLNDHLGHVAGDMLLRQVAQRLEGVFAHGATLARLGGDEFGVLVDELEDESGAMAEVRRIQDCFKDPFAIDGHILRVGASIGASMFPDNGDSATALMKAADAAMYSAKERGIPVQFATPEIQELVSRRFTLERDLAEGIRAGQFVVYHQPQVRLSDGEVIGSEALVRWNHPARGLLFPGEFITIAEDTNLIVDLGSFVLDQSLEHLAAWRRKHQGLRVSLNVSAKQLVRDLPRQVKMALEHFELEPDWLELELTESMLLQDLELATEILRELRGLGVRIALDDFGTGYSSLAYLRRFPVHTLKIDRSLVADICHDEGAANVCRAIVSLGKSLDLDIIAEGVETEKEAKMLADMGCTFAQGYLWAKPIPASDFEAAYIE